MLPSRIRSAAPLVLALVCAGLVAGCGSSSFGGSGGKPAVVATTTQLADFARQVGGDRISVHQILGPNADPHQYEPRPSDAGAVADADLVLQSGGDVDSWLDGVIDNAGGNAKRVKLSDAVHTRRLDGDLDPHWWQDPRNAELAVAAIRRALARTDPAGRKTFARNAAAYTRRLQRLDRATAKCIGRLPKQARNLVTTHDAFGYYVNRYGLHLIGALIPSLSTEAQPNARDTQRLVDQIRATHTRAIFPETSINPRLEKAVERETKAKVGRGLYGDTLGPEGSAGATYIGSIRSNTDSIVDGLSGGKRHCPAAG